MFLMKKISVIYVNKLLNNKLNNIIYNSLKMNI